jgi:hypothetical protein
VAPTGVTKNLTGQKSFSPQAFNDSLLGGFGMGSNGVNISLLDEGMDIGEAIVDYETSAEPPPLPPHPTLSTQERKLIQNGALSLIVEKAEDAVTNLSKIAEKLGGRIDSVGFYNGDGVAKKQATVVMRIPAVNFSAGMDQVKSIAKKVQSENISTEDITEKFIDMQARLKNLKAEEEQYLEIMKKAVKIDDILKVSQKLYFVRQQIEQLQGQMNYLSRQVDMSVITIQLSSLPDIVPTNVEWSPSTTVKEATQGLIDGFYAFLKILIFLAIYLLPILILWISVSILSLWLIWKLLLAFKKRVHIDAKKHELWYNNNVLTDNKK